MLPFSVQIKSGESVYGQVVYAVKKAIVVGQLRPGDRFPSVRVLSQELKINPNTAHKIVAQLVQERLLEVQSGIGSVIAATTYSTKEERRALLGADLERVVVEAKKLALDLDDVQEALQKHWEKLNENKR
jgi:GntR family transcriptional regulator